MSNCLKTPSLSLVSLKMIRLVLVRVYRCFKSFKISISFSFFSVAVVFFYFSLWGKTNVRWMEKKIQGSVRVMKHLRIGEWKISSCVDFFSSSNMYVEHQPYWIFSSSSSSCSSWTLMCVWMFDVSTCSLHSNFMSFSSSLSLLMLLRVCE